MSRLGRDSGPSLTPFNAKPGAEARVISGASRWGNTGVIESVSSEYVWVLFEDGARQQVRISYCQLWKPAPPDLLEALAVVEKAKLKIRVTVSSAGMPAGPTVAGPMAPTPPGIDPRLIPLPHRDADEEARLEAAEAEVQKKQKIASFRRTDADWDF